MKSNGMPVRALIAGAVAGALATWFMDLVTTGVQQTQSAADAEREAAARPHGQSSVTNLVDLMGQRLGISLDQASRELAANVLHYALGIIPGAAYAAFRSRIPAVGAGRGLLFGRSCGWSTTSCSTRRWGLPDHRGPTRFHSTCAASPATWSSA